MDNFLHAKEAICVSAGLVGGFIATLLGGWDTGLETLVIFMVADYITGLIVAGVFKKSPKTETGALESGAGLKGLCRKFFAFVFVLIAHYLDLVMGTTYIRDTVIIAFIANELISLVENAGLMGLPLPTVITKAIDILQKKTAIEESKAEEKEEVENDG
jgi:toxin secretion/phage lysis holin